MLIFNNIEKIDTFPEDENYYDLAIFASGFELRSICAAKKFRKETAKNIIVLGFDTQSDVLKRKQNDSFFSEKFCDVIECEKEDTNNMIFNILNLIVEDVEERQIRIFIDYSVMTRSWYASVLTWAQFSCHIYGVELDFYYVAGEYSGELDPLSISEVTSLQGFEGNSGGYRTTTAIFGLGYDRYSTLAVCDRLEPDDYFCFIAQHEAGDESSKKVLAENAVVIDSTKNEVLYLPLLDVTSAFRLLSELVINIDKSTHLVILPMGPKTHILTSLLVGLRFPHVTCLYAKGERVNPIDVIPSGLESFTRITFTSYECFT